MVLHSLHFSGGRCRTSPNKPRKDDAGLICHARHCDGDRRDRWMSVIGRIAAVWIVIVAVIRVAVTATGVIVPVVTTSETKETPVVIEATTRPGKVLTGNAVTDTAHMTATKPAHMATT